MDKALHVYGTPFFIEADLPESRKHPVGVSSRHDRTGTPAPRSSDPLVPTSIRVPVTKPGRSPTASGRTGASPSCCRVNSIPPRPARVVPLPPVKPVPVVNPVPPAKPSPQPLPSQVATRAPQSAARLAAPEERRRWHQYYYYYTQ